MCNQGNSDDDINKSLRKGKKRKAEFEEFDEIFVPPKRISPFLNTPKEKKEERKKVLKISIQKLKHLEDPEHFLRRSVLINNTMKRLQTEVREEKMKQPKYGRRNKAVDFSYGMLNNNCLSSSYMYDDPFLCNVHEKITDDMTDTLMSNLRDRLGDIPNGDTEVKQESKPEMEVMVQCENETNQSDVNTQSKCNQDSSSCALCSHCNNNNSCESITNIDGKNVQSEIQTKLDIGETSYSKDFNFIVRGRLTDESSTSEKYDHFSNDVRTTYLTPNNNRLENVPESFINKTVLNCSNRLDLNMIIETEVMSHSDIKPSADYSRSPSHFQDGIYAY